MRRRPSPRPNAATPKEKRSDCPLLTLGLVLDGSGFVRRSEVFSGAVNEDTTLAPMLDALGAPARALVAMDAGVATEANVVWLRENGYRYLVVSRERARRFDLRWSRIFGQVAKVYSEPGGGQGYGDQTAAIGATEEYDEVAVRSR